jgi:hypothetical protein
MENRMTVAAGSEVCTIYRSNTTIVGSKPTRGMDEYLYLCCPLQAETFPVQEPYQLRINNKMCWEELIAYFPWYDTGHIENDASNNASIVACVFVTAVTLLPSRCLATIGGFLLSRCVATIRGFLPSRCLATIGGGTHRHTHTDSNVIS